MRRQIVLGALLLFGCARNVRSVDPANWMELQSEHFILRTDIPEEEAREAIAELELERAGLLAAGWHAGRDFSERILVVELASLREVNEFAAKGYEGFAGRDPFGQPLIVVPAGDEHVFKHELTHILLAAYLVTQPRWVQEGLAGYMETLRVDRRNGDVVRGEMRRERLEFLERFPTRYWFDEVINVGDSFWSMGTFASSAFETRATAIVHWMIDTRLKAFDAYLGRLSRGENAWVAFTAEFPDLHEDQLRAGLGEYLRHPRAMRASRFPLPPSSRDVQRRAISRAEVYATRAALLQYGPHEKHGAERDRLVDAELARALAEDPGNPLALRLARDADPAAAARAHPEDYRSWVLAFDKSHETTAIERAAELAPQDPGVLWRLAMALQNQGKNDEALRTAERAMDLGRSRSDVLDAAAWIYAANNRCDEARATEQRAIESVPDSASAETPASFRARMNELNNHCEERSQQRALQRTVVFKPVLRRCTAAMPRVRSRRDGMEARFTIGEDGSVSGVSISGQASKALQAQFKRYVESCSFEPFVLEGKVRAAQSTMQLPAP